MLPGLQLRPQGVPFLLASAQAGISLLQVPQLLLQKGIAGIGELDVDLMVLTLQVI